MRCIACDKALSSFEATRKDEQNNFIDMCNNCFKHVEDEVPNTVRVDLVSEADYNEAEDDSLS
jgi:hypothetical protein